MQSPARHSLSAVTLSLLAGATSAQSWREATPMQSPAARESHGMVFDEARGKTVLFGGYHWTMDQHFADTWEYDGATWTQRTTPAALTARKRMAMCYDTQRNVTILFGGFRGSTFQSPTYFGDTWEYDGTSWQPTAPSGPAPSARFSAMAYDSARGVAVLFGGTAGSSPHSLHDTWEYDGSAWTQRTPQHAPPHFSFFTMAYDAHRGVTVLHQGYTFGNTTPMQTWEWDGNDWTQVTTPSYAPSLSKPAMTYDPARRCCVLVGSTYVGGAETYLYNGSDWHLIQGHTFGGTRTGHAVVYDSARGANVLFGGEEGIGAFIYESDETWEEATWAQFDTFGSGCAATGTAPSLLAVNGSLPQPGTTMTTRVDGLAAGDIPLLVLGESDETWQGLPLPIGLGNLGLPGCELFVAADAVLLLDNVAGQADHSFVVPTALPLAGHELFEQAVVLDATIAFRAVSNAAVLTVGL